MSILNNRTKGRATWILSVNAGKRRLVKMTEGGGERTISPLLPTGPLYDWIDAFLEGIDVGNDKQHAALMVITTTASIREFLAKNDPKALAQCEEALK